MTYDGSQVRLYTDGKLEYAGSQSGSAVSGLQYYIGGDNINNAMSNGFTGAIDDVRVYERALTSYEVGRIYAEAASRYMLAEAGR